MEVVSGGEGSSGQLKLLYPLLFSLQACARGRLAQRALSAPLTCECSFGRCHPMSPC